MSDLERAWLISTTPPSATTNSSIHTHSNLVELFETSVLFFLAGIGCVIGIVILTYIICILMDRCCNCFPELHNDNPRTILGGAIARDAGLTGITKGERRNVYEFVLAGKSYKTTELYNRQQKSDDDGDKDDDHTASTIDDDRSTANTTSNVAGEHESTQEICDAANDDLVTDSNGITCAICLSDYVGDDVVIESKHCTHVFHKDCILRWLEKNDVCPCCRVPMITSDEMKTAALQFLDKGRYQHLVMGYDSSGAVVRGEHGGVVRLGPSDGVEDLESGRGETEMVAVNLNNAALPADAVQGSLSLWR